MNYSDDFRQALNLCKAKGLQYLGTGNPQATILIIGKECGIDPVKNDEHYKREIVDNLTDWTQNIDSNTQPNQVKIWKDGGSYNPLYPYKGDDKTSKTWGWYQKLADGACARVQNNAWKIDFHENIFLSEMSEIVRKTSAKNDPDTIASRHKRLALFSESSFFQNFPIVILACNDYIEHQQIYDTFGVEFVEKRGAKAGQYFWVHYNADKTKMVIHTRQLSTSVSGDLVNEIAHTCKMFMNNVIDYHKDGGATIKIGRVNSTVSLVVEYWKTPSFMIEDIDADIKDSDSEDRTCFLNKVKGILRDWVSDGSREYNEERITKEDDDFGNEIGSGVIRVPRCWPRHSLAWYLFDCLSEEITKVSLHIEDLKGYSKILGSKDGIIKIITIIRESTSPQAAIERTMNEFKLTKHQANYLINMNLGDLGNNENILQNIQHWEQCLAILNRVANL